jgi:hypothetical protein
MATPAAGLVFNKTDNTGAAAILPNSQTAAAYQNYVNQAIATDLAAQKKRAEKEKAWKDKLFDIKFEPPLARFVEQDLALKDEILGNMAAVTMQAEAEGKDINDPSVQLAVQKELSRGQQALLLSKELKAADDILKKALLDPDARQELDAKTWDNYEKYLAEPDKVKALKMFEDGILVPKFNKQQALEPFIWEPQSREDGTTTIVDVPWDKVEKSLYTPQGEQVFKAGVAAGEWKTMDEFVAAAKTENERIKGFKLQQDEPRSDLGGGGVKVTQTGDGFQSTGKNWAALYTKDNTGKVTSFKINYAGLQDKDIPAVTVDKTVVSKKDGKVSTETTKIRPHGGKLKTLKDGTEYYVVTGIEVDESGEAKSDDPIEIPLSKENADALKVEMRDVDILGDIKGSGSKPKSTAKTGKKEVIEW